MDKLKLLALDIKHSRIVGFSADGTTLTTILDSCGGVPDGIAVDKVRGHIYWTNMGTYRGSEDFMENDGFIERCDLDGTNRTIIVPPGGTFTPKQLQLDLKNDLLYWCDREGMRVMRANLDGTAITTLVETGRGEEERQDRNRHCVGLALDVPNGHLYWSQKGPAKGGAGRIFRASLVMPAGFSPSHRPDTELLYAHLPEPIDLHLNEQTGELYWTDRGSPPTGNTLNRARVQPSAALAPEVLVTGLHEAIGLALDVAQDYVYFTDLGGHLYRARLDGREFCTLHAGSGMFTGIACLSN